MLATDTSTPRYTAIPASEAVIIRPLDERARAALRKLAAEAGATIHRGSVRLGDGSTHAALLAVRSGDGMTLAALLDNGEDATAAAEFASEPSLTTCTR